LITAMCEGWVCRTHGCVHLLLLHLIGKLERIRRRQILHLRRLHGIVSASGSKMLGGRNHPHVDILLVGSLYLLLLLL